MTRYLVIALIAIVFTGCATVDVYQSAFQSPPQKLDGRNDDWAGKMYYDSKAKMLYGISNDTENLYVNIKITDYTVQKKVLVTGLTLWIDTVGKKQENFGITCPVEGEFHKLLRENVKRGEKSHGMKKMDKQAVNHEYKEGFAKMELSGFEPDVNSVTTNKNVSNINMTLRIDSLQIMYYEASIPLNKIFTNPNEYLNDTTKLFSYGVETGSIDVPVTPSSAGGRGSGAGKGGGRGAGGAGKGGGGSRTANSSQRMVEMQEMAQPSKFWVKSARLSPIIK